MDPEIVDHYSLGIEEERLTEGNASRIEFARTKELLERYLPAPPARILDVGGGPGRYASWLAGLGHRVDLIDAVPLHVEQARARADQGDAFTAQLGDARELSVEDAAYDAVLLLGPLYHLPDREDRLQALREASRAVAPGGPVVVAAISRFASLLDGLLTGALSDPEFRAIVDLDLQTGHHANPTGSPEFFTTAYFHRPDELDKELTDAGLVVEAILGVEGPGWLRWERWDEPAGRSDILRVARAVEQEPTLIGASAHLLAVGRR